MVPFLKRVAMTFVAGCGRIDDMCFVFPNRRSCAFFRKYLNECAVKPMMLPEILTISDFVSLQSGLIDAGRIEQLFALYDAYSRIVGKAVVDFDHFLYWGDMIIGDFNDVDMYMVDAEELFRNVENLKAINADYLTSGQREVINDFFGEYRSAGSGHLWIDDSGKKRYLRLWSILYDLYRSFKSGLAEKGLSYSGNTYRVAAERIKNMAKDDFGYGRIVFVGFSTLSKSEECIFDCLKNLGIGDYYWDFNSPVFSDSENKGTVFLQEYVKRYPSGFDIGEPEISVMPDISIISVPSGGGQAKVAAQVIDGLIDNKAIENPGDAIDTALILPEEKYLGSVLHSVPERIGALNITMGYPLSSTPVASLMRAVAVMYSHKRIKGGVVSFYYDDLDSLLSHPYISALCASDVEAFKKEVVDRRLFFVDVATILELLPSLHDIFYKCVFESPSEIIGYIKTVVSVIEKRIIAVSGGDAMQLDRYFICRYMEALTELESIVMRYNIGKISEKTFFFLVDRMVGGATVAFEGEPMQGLQVMGILETRLLDFKNIILFSMNERVFPAKHYVRSFIPEVLRTAYGISTYRKQDAMFTYYFYRMISRAEKVFLLYDSRTQGVASGEVSRYVSQLRMLYNRGKCHEYVYNYNVLLPVEPLVEVVKTGPVMDKLRQYVLPETSCNFSASMVNTYIDCPLKFYFKYVEGIREDDEIKDFIDSATFGTIVHGIMQRVYDGVPVAGGKRIVDRKYLENLASSKSVGLQKIVAEVVGKEYDKNKDGGGDVEVIKNIIIYYIVPVLKHDMSLTPFEYIGSEVEQVFRWRLGDGLTVNYKQIIDRIDRVDGTLRIVDYKTGSDKTSVSNFENIFAGKSEGHLKAVMQIMLYCNAYSAVEGFDGDIMPVIYSIRNVRTMDENERFCIKYNKQPVLSYRNETFKDEFMSRFCGIVEDILNPDIPFRQTCQQSKCAYCPFAEACNRG